LNKGFTLTAAAAQAMAMPNGRRHDDRTAGGGARMRPRRVFPRASDNAVPYSERKAMGDAVAAWPLKNVVYCQVRACQGANIDEIARETNVPSYAVARVLNPEPKAERPSKAGVSRPRLKARRRGFF
jgi:hypothetical protein